MPIYEYHCNGCNLDFEEIMAYNYADEAKCPKCGGNVIRKPSTYFFNNYPVRNARASHNGKIIWER